MKPTYLNSNLFVYACLFVFDLFLELFQSCSIWGCAVRLKDLNVPGGCQLGASKTQRKTYSSVRGVIFFSGSSSSAKVLRYFSQLLPVAEGMLPGWKTVIYLKMSRSGSKYIEPKASNKITASDLKISRESCKLMHGDGRLSRWSPRTTA